MTWSQLFISDQAPTDSSSEISEIRPPPLSDLTPALYRDLEVFSVDLHSVCDSRAHPPFPFFLRLRHFSRHEVRSFVGYCSGPPVFYNRYSSVRMSPRVVGTPRVEGTLV